MDKACKFFEASEKIMKNQIALDSKLYIELTNKIERNKKSV